MDNLGDFFSLIGEEKKKTKKKTKDLIGDLSLDDLFSNLKKEKNKLRKKEEKKLEERNKLIKKTKVFESSSFNETTKTEQNAINAVKVLETELVNLKNASYKSINRLMRGISAEYNITPTKLHNQFKEKHNLIPDDWVKQQKEEVDTTDWKDNYKPLEVESVDIIKPERLKPTESVVPYLGVDDSNYTEKIEEEIAESIEELETLAKIRDDVDVKVDKSTNMLKSIEILDKLTPDKEIDSVDKDSEVNTLKREIDQLRKMVYETVRHTSTIGGGGAGFIKDLDDVNIAGLQNGYVLIWDQANNQWKVGEKTPASDLGTLAGLATADPTSIPNGDVVIFDSASGQFITTSSIDVASNNIAGYPVDTSTPSDNAVIAFNQAGQNWVFDTPFQVVDLSDGVEDGHQDYGSFDP